jgi:hypothetical protein
MSAPNAESSQPNDPSAEYVCLGNFDPLVARRIINRFAEHQVPYEARDASSLDMAGAGIGEYDGPLTRYPIHARINRVRLWVPPDYQRQAARLIDEV